MPGSKETARRTASSPSSLQPGNAGWRRGERWLGVDHTARMKAKKHHCCCYLSAVGERQGSQGKEKNRFILAAGLDVCQNERELRSGAGDLGSRMQEV